MEICRKGFRKGALKMPITYIIECSQCSGLLLAAADQKSRTCPFCGARVNLEKSKRLSSADNSMIASEMLRKIKAERQLNTRKPTAQIQPQTRPRASTRTRPRRSKQRTLY